MNGSLRGKALRPAAFEAAVEHGTVMTDLILGRDNPWPRLYDPSRVNAKALPTYAKDNLTVAALYKDLATPGQVSDVSEIAPRTGAVTLPPSIK